jgi:hypothetical protein
MKQNRLATLCVALGLASFLNFSAQAQITVDGTREADYGTALSVQSVTSGWGAGNVLASISAKQEGGSLKVFLAGRATGNALFLFIDSKSGGANVLVNNLITGADAYEINSFGTSASAGMTFESGFSPDYAIRIHAGGWTSLLPLAPGSARSYLGQSTVATVSGGPVTALRTVWNDVTGSYGSHSTGVEIDLNFAGLGVPTGSGQTVKLMALLVGEGSNWGSNQTLGSLPVGSGDLAGGITSANFNTISGTQTISMGVDNLDADGDGIGDATDPDDDNDGLNDTVETNTGTFVDANNTGTNPLLADTDGDGFNDGAEVNGTSSLARVTSPLKKNYATMTVAGNFQSPDIFQAIPYPTNAPVNVMTRVSGEEFAYTLNYNFRTVGNIQAKFAAGSWTQNWGGTTNSTTVAVSGGSDIPLTVAGTGFHTFSFNHDTLAYSFARTVFADFAAYAAAYALTGDESADQDSDGLSNGTEFTNNTDPTRANDALAPVITLANSLVALVVGSNYTADAATATDLTVPGGTPATLDPATITNNSAATGILDVNTPGTYTVTYSVTDAAGNTGTATQKVVVYAAGTLASQYPSIAVPGVFNGWSETGSAGNALTKTANFQWKLVRYFTEAGATGGYKFLAGGSWGGKEWAPAPRDGGGNSDLAAQVTANGWYVFEVNEITDTASLTLLAINGTTDVDNDGLPDVWEAWYGAFLPSPGSNLDPAEDYNLNGQTTLQDYTAGLNPTQDVTPPTISLTTGVDKLTLVALNDTVDYGPLDVDVSEGTPVVTTVPATPDTTVAGLIKVTYTVTDAAGNSASVSRVIAVGDTTPNYHGMTFPRALTIHTAGNGKVYGQIFIDGATQGAGAAPQVQAEIGVSPTNDNPSGWDSGAWSAATYLGEIGNNDEYEGVIAGVGKTVGTPLYYALRWRIGSGPYVYSGITQTGTVAGDAWGTYDQGTPPVAMTYGNGALTVEAGRQVTYAVDMGVQIFKGAFDPATNGVEVRGDFNSFSGGGTLVRDGTSSIFTNTFAVGGAEGSTNKFKFYTVGTNAVGFEEGADREAVLTASGTPLNTGTNFFSNLTESRKITFRVDMSVQAAKGAFNTNSGVVQIAGSFNGWSTTATPLSAQGNGVYAAEVTVDGPVSGISYKFLKGTAEADYEVVSDRTISAVLPNLAASTLDVVLFGNDDGVAPTDISLSASSIAENNAVNAVVGTLSSTDASAGDTHTYSLVTGTGDTDNASFNISGSDLRAGGAFDFETKASYSIRVRSTDSKGNSFEDDFIITVTDVNETPAGSTFAGWSGGAATNSELVGKYGIGGASSPTAQGEAPTVGKGFLTPNHYSYIEAIVRTDDSKLTITGESTTDLVAGFGSTGTWTTEGASLGVSQAGVPTGCERKRFIYWHGMTQNRMFMRLKATLDP